MCNCICTTCNFVCGFHIFCFTCFFFIFFSFKFRSHSFLLISFPPAFILFTLFLYSFCHVPFLLTGHTWAVLPHLCVPGSSRGRNLIWMRHGHISDELARVQGMDICQDLPQIWVNRWCVFGIKLEWAGWAKNWSVKTDWSCTKNSKYLEQIWTDRLKLF